MSHGNGRAALAPNVAKVPSFAPLVYAQHDYPICSCGMMNYNGRTGGDDVFLEYDPTPSGGGYDQVLAYGEPLSSSHETCYPPESKADPSLNRENFTYGHGSCEDSRYQEEVPNFIANSNGGDVDRPRYPLDSEPWKGDPSHPYGYGKTLGTNHIQYQR